jgi:hypothetical protein
MGLGDFTSGLASGMGTMQAIQTNRQRQKMNEYALNELGRDAKTRSNETAVGDAKFKSEYGEDAGSWKDQFSEDPFLFRLIGKLKGGQKKPVAALPQATPTGAATAPAALAPAVDSGVQTFGIDDPEELADGGDVKGPPDRNGVMSAIQIPRKWDNAFQRAPATNAQRRVRYGDNNAAIQNERKDDEQLVRHSQSGGNIKERFYADGGDVEDDSPSAVRERAAANRARTSDRGGSSTESVKGADRSASTPKEAVKAGKLKTGLGGLAAGAGIAGAVQGLGTPTEEYAARMGIDPSQVGLSFWKDAGIRAAGVMGDVGEATGVPALYRRLTQGTPAPAAAAPAEAAPEAPAPESPAAAVSLGSASRRGPAAAAPAAPSAPAKPQPGDAIDFSKLDIHEDQLPNLTLNDWKAYRKEALRRAANMGQPYEQAKQMADQQVAQMQTRGFTQYASQAQRCSVLAT